MLKPKREALDRLGEFRRTGFADLGEAKVERKGKIGHVTVTNPKFLNAESDVTTVATEIAIDLVLLDDAIEVGVLRGGVVQHPKYAGRRVFDSGINLTHLYYGQISFVEFLIEREMGLMHKILRGHWRSESYDEQFEDYVEKPWLAAVETFAIGGGCQLLCVMDRVLAEPGSYFNLPASKEGFIPGAANLRLPRLVGIKLAREGIFFERVFHARIAGRADDLRRDRPRRGDGRGDRAGRAAARAGGNDQHRRQPQGAARRAGAVVDLSPLHGDLCAAAGPLSLRPASHRQSRAQLATRPPAYVTRRSVKEDLR